MTEWLLSQTIHHLEHAAEHAKKAGLGAHFLSELNHLVATARYNSETLGQGASGEYKKARLEK